jgi:hypothetical protein
MSGNVNGNMNGNEEKTLICLLPPPSDNQGNLYKTSKQKLEELAELLCSFVQPSTVWLHDGARPSMSTILCIGPLFKLQVSRRELEEEMEAAEVETSPQMSPRPVAWLPSLELQDSVEGPRPLELAKTRNDIFARLEKGGSVLVCTSELHFRTLFACLGGIPYDGQLNAGDAIVLQFVEKERASADGHESSLAPRNISGGYPGLAMASLAHGKTKFVLTGSKRLSV